jgi:hypothetical protein
MIKKISKVILVFLMVLGIFFAISNVMVKELTSKQFPVVKYIPEEPDCRGEGNTCIDMTEQPI